jgi:hypothetical protein
MRLRTEEGAKSCTSSPSLPQIFPFSNRGVDEKSCRKKSEARSLGKWVCSERVLRPPTWRISSSFRFRWFVLSGVLDLWVHRYHYRPSFADAFFCIYIMLQNLLLAREPHHNTISQLLSLSSSGTGLAGAFCFQDIVMSCCDTEKTPS